MFHQQSRCDFTQIWKSWALHHNRNSSMFVEYSNKIDIFIGMIACTVRRFCHCNTLLLPQVCRNMQHRDRTQRRKTSFRSHLMFRIQSCIFSFGMHSSSRTRTRDTTLIHGLPVNHGWNCTFVSREGSILASCTIVVCRSSQIWAQTWGFEPYIPRKRSFIVCIDNLAVMLDSSQPRQFNPSVSISSGAQMTMSSNSMLSASMTVAPVVKGFCTLVGH